MLALLFLPWIEKVSAAPNVGKYILLINPADDNVESTLNQTLIQRHDVELTFDSVLIQKCV